MVDVIDTGRAARPAVILRHHIVRLVGSDVTVIGGDLIFDEIQLIN